MMSAMPSLGQTQREFAHCVGRLIVWTFDQPDAELRLDEALRTQAQANANALSGAGIPHSNHLIHLAIDMPLYLKGVYQTDSAAYKFMGDYWKTLHPLARWGGDFKPPTNPDGNHFSFEWQGIK